MPFNYHSNYHLPIYTYEQRNLPMRSAHLDACTHPQYSCRVIDETLVLGMKYEVFPVSAIKNPPLIQENVRVSGKRII